MCDVCKDKKYIVASYDSKPCVERCDECQWHGEDNPSTLWDEEAAKLAQADGIKCEDIYPCFVVQQIEGE